jgi:hypothetical protein
MVLGLAAATAVLCLVAVAQLVVVAGLPLLAALMATNGC